MSIIWATCTTENYLPKARAYLASVAEHGHRRVCYRLGCVGFAPPDDLPSPWQAFQIPLHMLDERWGNPGSGCIQHGNWIPYLPAESDDMIVLTDADITMQRSLTPDEWKLLDDWPAGAVGIGPNASPADTLLDEARRIRIRVDDLPPRFWPGRDAPLCGNAGVLIARRGTWLELWAACLALHEDVRPLFPHAAAMQWTINLAIDRVADLVVLPYSFHAHQHYGIPPGCEDRDGVAYFEDAPVLLAHHWW